MKKSNRKPSQKGRKSPKPTDAGPSDPSRRSSFNVLRNSGIALALGGAGWFSVSAVRATAAEQDLTRVGQGIPTIVQIHDPQCPMCTRLQREARKAMRCFESEDLVYLVANIRGDEGARFAARHGVPHVTLMLFDGAGDVQNVLNGVRDRDVLKPDFAALAGVPMSTS